MWSDNNSACAITDTLVAREARHTGAARISGRGQA